jgi:hypothetical protein
MTKRTFSAVYLAAILANVSERKKLILFPTVIPNGMPAFVTVDRIGTSYTATIGGPDCHQSTACASATVDGAPGHLDKNGRRPVRLKNGTTAWFEQHRCEANCEGSATLVFEKAGMLYTVGVKAGTLAETVIIANGLRLRT